MIPNMETSEATKLLVHPDSRKCGIARELMIELGRGADPWPGFSLAPDHSGYDATTYMYKQL